MRDLKFRAWDKQTGKFTDHFMLGPTSPTWSAFPIESASQFDHVVKAMRGRFTDKELWDLGLIGFATSDYTLTDWANYYGINNYVVEQYTGLRDKNGREVYEGDIVRKQTGSVWENGIDRPLMFVGAVEWGGPTGYRFGNLWLWANDGLLLGFEVIGNIHEHPDLLKESEE